MTIRAKKTGSSVIEPIILCLNDPKNLTLLLHSDNNSLITIDELTWGKMPVFYGQALPRASFVVDNCHKQRFFIKLNMDIAKIQTENFVDNIFKSMRAFSFQIPDILASNLDNKTQQETPCGWLIQNWIDGRLINFDTLNKDLILRTAHSLAELHSREISSNDISKLLHINLPSMTELSKIEAEHKMNELALVSETVPLSLAKHFGKTHDKILALYNSSSIRLVHGDFHFFNIMVSNLSEQPSLFFIDWEDAHLDHPFVDVAHLIAKTDSDVSHFFLKSYYEALSTEIHDDFETFGAKIYEFAVIWVARWLRWKLKLTHDKIEQERIFLSTEAQLKEILRTTYDDAI